MQHKYTESIIGFYDILGFGHYTKSNKGAEKIYKLFSSIKKAAEFDNTEKSMFSKNFIHFSDTFVRTTPLINRDGVRNKTGVLFHEILSAVHIQIELIYTEEIFLRGSISIGEIYHENDIIFGPAIVDAYKLESEVAVFPRIVIDPKALVRLSTTRDLSNTVNSTKMETGYCMDMLRQGDDGIWFVDYLHAAYSEFDENMNYIDLLRRHKKMILREASKVETITKVSLKLSWLTKYHNDTVLRFDNEKLTMFGGSHKELLISTEEFPLQFQPVA